MFTQNTTAQTTTIQGGIEFSELLSGSIVDIVDSGTSGQLDGSTGELFIDSN